MALVDHKFWPLYGVATFSLPLLLLLLEIALDSSNHNLFPFEIITMLALGISGVVGALIGMLARKLINWIYKKILPTSSNPA